MLSINNLKLDPSGQINIDLINVIRLLISVQGTSLVTNCINTMQHGQTNLFTVIALEERELLISEFYLRCALLSIYEKSRAFLVETVYKWPYKQT